MTVSQHYLPPLSSAKWPKMPLGPQDDMATCRRVPCSVREVTRRCASGCRQNQPLVSKVGEAQVRATHDSAGSARDLPLIPGARYASEDKVVRSRSREVIQVATNSLSQELRDCNRSTSRGGFRLLDQRLPTHGDCSPLFDVMSRVDEVDILTPESKQISTTQLTSGRERHDSSFLLTIRNVPIRVTRHQ